MSEYAFSMQVLKRSRKALRAGDFFVYQMRDQPYGFGRVIAVGTAVAAKTYLIYVYDSFAVSKLDIPTVSKTRLLIPPQITFIHPWTSGYFETVAHRPLCSDDVMAVHCFRSSWSKRPYLDEFGNPLEGRIEPCGDYSVTLCGGLDYLIGKALGMSPPAGGEGMHEDDDADENRAGVTIFVRLAGNGFGTITDQQVVAEIEDSLIEELRNSHLGEVEGNAFGKGFGRIFVQGKDVEALAAVVQGVLKGVPKPQGSYLVKHFVAGVRRSERVELS